MIRNLYLIVIACILFPSTIFAQIHPDSLTVETILSLPEDEIDLGIACLVLAKDAYPDLEANVCWR